MNGPGVFVATVIGVTPSVPNTLLLFGVTATPNGDAPTGITCVTVLVARLMSLTVPSPWLATYSCVPSGLTASRSGWLPTVTGVPAVSVATLIGVTVPSPKLLTHTVLPSGVAATPAA